MSAPTSPKRVLLTGATGFVGRHCVPMLLAQGYELHGVTRRRPYDDAVDPRIVWHEADLRDSAEAAALAGRVRATHLLHLAWNAVPGKFWTDPDNLDWLTGSIALVKCFGALDGERAVIAGSCAEYDWRYGICHEDETPTDPATIYGRAKLAMAEAAAAAAQIYGFSLAWGRLFFPYGPGEPAGKLIPSVAQNLLAGRPAPVTHGRQLRDFIHVTDAAAACVALLGSAASGAFNIASGEPVSLRHVVELVAKAVGRPDLVQYGALPQRSGEPPVLIADIQKIIRATGWQPGIALADGITASVAWWRAQGVTNPPA